MPRAPAERVSADPHKEFEELVRLLQQVRDAVLMYEGLKDAYIMIQAEDERHHARRGHGAISQNGYKALTEQAEQRLKELTEHRKKLEELVRMMRNQLFT